MKRLLLCGLLLISAQSSAYETDTHALMTYHSFDRSLLVGSDFASRCN